jgi:hypothetical protein
MFEMLQSAITIVLSVTLKQGNMVLEHFIKHEYFYQLYLWGLYNMNSNIASFHGCNFVMEVTLNTRVNVDSLRYLLSYWNEIL